MRPGIRVPGWNHVVALFQWEKRLLARFVVDSLGAAGAALGVIVLIQQFLAGALGGGGGLPGALGRFVGPGTALGITAGLLLLTYIAGALFAYDNQVTQQRIVKVLELGLMERVIRHLLSLSVPFFDRQSHGDIMQAVRGDVSQLRQVVVSLANMVLEALITVALVGAAVWVSPWLALWGLLALPLAAFPVYLVAKRTLARSFGVRVTGYALFDMVLQILRGIRVIKAFKGEEHEARLAVEKGGAYFDQVIELVRIRAMARVFLEALAGLGVVVVIVVGGLQVMRGESDWPALLAFVMALRQLQGPLNNLNHHYVQIQELGASVDRLARLLDERAEISDRPGARELRHVPSRFELKNASFGYGGQPVIRAVSLEVARGQVVGIVGPSGAGKSTLLNLIVRFYDPSEGAVLFDGVDLRDYRVADVYDKVAIVTQEPFLFAASVRDNIRCGRPEATEAEVEASARAAFIHEDVLALPEGYDTLIGLGGRGLSGGQSQRINIARALLKNAPILLLDEATSSLDSVAEAEVQRAIEKLMEGRTSFVVAHRLSTLRYADKILVLEAGVLVGEGPHAVLVDTCPVYRKLWETQRLEGSRDEARPATVATPLTAR